MIGRYLESSASLLIRLKHCHLELAESLRESVRVERLIFFEVNFRAASNEGSGDIVHLFQGHTDLFIGVTSPTRAFDRDHIGCSRLRELDFVKSTHLEPLAADGSGDLGAGQLSCAIDKESGTEAGHFKRGDFRDRFESRTGLRTNASSSALDIDNISGDGLGSGCLSCRSFRRSWRSKCKWSHQSGKADRTKKECFLHDGRIFTPEFSLGKK